MDVSRYIAGASRFGGMIALTAAVVTTSRAPMARAEFPNAVHMLRSPDSRIHVEVRLPAEGSAEVPAWSASFQGRPLFTECRLRLQTREAGDMLAGAKLMRARERTHDARVKILFGKADSARDRYRETRLELESSGKRRIDVVFRCFDDAITFRFEVPRGSGFQSLTITDEDTSFALAGDPAAYVQYCENYQTSHEHEVVKTPCSAVRAGALLDTPALFSQPNGTHVAITEAALRKYAGMYLMRAEGETALTCRLAPRPDGTKVVRELPMATPWRVALIGDRAGALLESNTLYCLNDPPIVKDTSWIKPGKMTWSWWNGNLLDPEKPGPILSLATVRRYVDFCARYGIRYHSVIADESDTPWYRQSRKGIAPAPDTDVTQPRDGFDMNGIRQYAEEKGIRLWTWIHQAALKGRVEEAFAAFEKLGWNGMMVDFFDHDDQETVEHAEAILQAAARHHIMLHFHGIWKPTGWQRTYPNLMNHEGALNLEYLKWSDRCTPEHDLNMAFTRLVAGPMDYHLGGFRALPRAQFKPRWEGPNVLGTRAHQLAMYVCFDNPQPMVADYPGAYEGQPGFEFIRRVPTWWDETRVLEAEVGKILVSARRRGAVWYLGGIAGAEGRNLAIPLKFLRPGSYRGRVWRDSPDSAAEPNHLTVEERTFTAADALRISMPAGGGFTAELTPK